MDELPEEVQRWTAKRRSALILSIIRGETSVQEAARGHGLTVAEVEDWREKFLAAAENALRSRPRDDEALKDEQIKRLKQKVGELVLDIDVLKEAQKGRPFDRETSDERERCSLRSRSAGSAVSLPYPARP
jgi:transposase-like protein